MIGEDVLVIFEEIELWMDPVKRRGPEAMAVDEWLCEVREAPLLRVYGWAGDWGSFGYFTPFAEADEALDGVEWVRRKTGGGIVDHRVDWTYSLIAPAGCEVARMRGGESYRVVHEALMRFLGGGVCLAGLGGGEGERGGGGECFSNPVRYDLMDGMGEKISGAAQRRTRGGLLHQGSVKGGLDEGMGMAFAGELAGRVVEVEIFPDMEVVGAMVAATYGTKEWLLRR